MESLPAWLLQTLGALGGALGLQVVLIGLPLAAAAWLLHWLEVFVLARLSAMFGWRSVLATGWLGTPVHELSHAAMCLVFRHRIKKIALFEPDRLSGRLGYVQHAYQPDRPWQVLGNFFIGLAPLVGGSAALYLLLWLLFPQGAADAWNLARGAGEGGSPLLERARGLLGIAGVVLGDLFRWEHVVGWRFWLFLYLTLCLGTHMPPSPSDYSGALRGGVLAAGCWLAVNLAAALLGAGPLGLLTATAFLWTPLLALLLLAVVLCGLNAALVGLLFQGWLRMTGRRVRG